MRHITAIGQSFLQQISLDKQTHICREELFRFPCPEHGTTALGIAEMQTGKIAFHTAAGLDNAAQTVEDGDVMGGPVALVCVQEDGYRGDEFQTDDPVGVKLIAAHSYDFVAPGASSAVRPSYIITGVNG